MNTERLQQLIDVMQRVVDRRSKFHIEVWRTPTSSRDLQFEPDEHHYHRCGMAACIGGWLAVSPEFKQVGGLVNKSGAPILPKGDFSFHGGQALALFLQCDYSLARSIAGLDDSEGYDFYNVKSKSLSASHVVKRITALKKEI